MATSKGVVSHAGVTMAEWQRSPKQLLHELCQSKKRPKPIWRNVRGTTQGKFRFRVVLPDPKKVRERDLVFTPSQTFSSKVEAEHMVALLALHHFDATRPHERRLPEPYRTAWISLVNGNKNDSKTTKTKKLSKQELKKQMKEKRTKYNEFRSSAIKRGETKIPTFEEWCNKEEDKVEEKKATAVPIVLNKNAVVQAVEMDDSGRPKQKCFHFLQHGECRYGSSCRFSHGAIQVQSTNTTMTTATSTTISSIGKYASQRERNVARIEREKKQSEARSKREARKRKFQAPRVIMSDKRRNEIARLLRSVRNAWDAEIDRKNRSMNKIKQRIERNVESENRVMKRLVKFGFCRKISQIAIKETRKRYERYDNNNNVNLADVLNWLLIYCPEENLPEKFNVKTVQVALTSDDSVELKRLLSYGFERSSCVNALKDYHDYSRALYVLYVKCLQGEKQEQEEDQEEEEDEDAVEALKAIYGDELEELMSLDEIKKEKKKARTTNLWYCKEWLCVRFEEIDGVKGKSELVFMYCFGCGDDDCDDRTASSKWCLFRNASLSKGELEAANQALCSLSRTADSLFELCSYVQDGLSETLKSRVLGNVSSNSISREKKIDDDESFFSMTSSFSAFGSCIATDKMSSSTRRHRRRPCKHAPKDMDLQKEMEEKRKSNSKFQDMQKVRQELPVSRYREQILKTVRNSQVTLISAQTGAGKTTQVPQFLLEELGASCNIVCTQPRRLAAIGVSQRVAEERCEPCGDVVGYTIRGESKTSTRTRLLFCTTGVLLRRLQYSGADGFTHVLIDEVHERGVNTDFLMCVLRDLLKRQESTFKIVLMSATLDAERFSKYFNSCPIINIPGRTFPVKEHYLEDVWRQVPDSCPGSSSSRDDEDPVESGLKLYKPGIDYEAITKLTVYLTRTTSSGAVLIFMPGVGEISKLVTLIQRRLNSGAWVLPLHGSLGSGDQRKVFQRPPKNVRKIVVSTNIAETSLTIDDVVYVIDSGRVKQMEYDALNRMPKLVDTWVSKASAQQRKGRAGRVRKGVCFRMYPSKIFRDTFSAYQLPEIKRVPLENVALQIKTLQIGRVPDILAKMMDPPDRASVC